MTSHEQQQALVVSYRGRCKVTVPLVPGVTRLHDVRDRVVAAANDRMLQPEHIKLVYKGQALHDGVPLSEQLPSMSTTTTTTTTTTIHLLATGISPSEQARMNDRTHAALQAAAPLVRDDLTETGQQTMAARQRLGRQLLHQAAQKEQRHNTPSPYRFGRIETLPNLPHRDQARQILEGLANDPGVLACLAKHGWNVGCLAELYPDGQVGQDPVCVLGLNENRGQRILVRIRTDDLQGFRKILTIRKTLYHELAHNEFGPHDDRFYQLMRQVERECTELDWTQGAGLTGTESDADINPAFQGGSGRLDSSGNEESAAVMHAVQPAHARREQAAAAAEARLRRQQQTGQQPDLRMCACGQIHKAATTCQIVTATGRSTNGNGSNDSSSCRSDMEVDEDGNNGPDKAVR